MRNTIAAVVAAILISVPAVAQTVADTKAEPVKEKKVCRRLDQTGSILGAPRTCHTKAEWAQIDSVNAENADRAKNSRPNGSSGGL